MQKTYLAITVAVAAGCHDDGVKCADPNLVTGDLVATAVREPVTADLAVRGTIRAPANATIYGVQVNGVDATSSSSNFRNWTATIPIGVLAAQSVEGKVTLAAVAFTNCGEEPASVGADSVVVGAGIQVMKLDVIPALPAGAAYLPSTKPGSAIVTIAANPQAVGASVAVKASIGTLSAASVVLGGDGMTASGQVLFSSSTAGTAVLTASVAGVSGVGAVTVIGAPTFAPDGATLSAGSSVRVTVLTDGRIESCQATPAATMHVASGPNTDLMRGVGGTDQTMDGLIDIDVSVDPGITAMTSTTISCRDPFGQVATATFVGQP